MLNTNKGLENGLSYSKVLKALKQASEKIAPLWPLENFVAVNPYLGLTSEPFESVGNTLSFYAGIKTTMPLDYYLKAIEEKKIEYKDLESVIQEKGGVYKDVETFMESVKDKAKVSPKWPKVQTLAEVAKQRSGGNWPDFMLDSISSWASSYFDQSQQQWKLDGVKMDLFTAWKIEAETNRAPSLMGLRGFHKLMKSLPNHHIEAARIALSALQIDEETLPVYLHSLLLRVVGWSSFIAHFDWDSKRYGENEQKLSEFLSVLICWEYGVFKSLSDPSLDIHWKKAKTDMLQAFEEVAPNPIVGDLMILQEAFDLSARKRLVKKIETNANKSHEIPNPPKVQAVFCIDVRSEVYRRNLESVAPEFDTLGFAGFFGFPIHFTKIGHDEGYDQCPALIPSGFRVKEKLLDQEENDRVVLRRKLSRSFRHAWKSFKSSAISSFGFVSPMGLSLLPKLFTDSFGFTRPVPSPKQSDLSQKYIDKLTVDLESNQQGEVKTGIPLADRVSMAKGALIAMSLKENFARVVMIVGHGSSSVNNPHASGLDCGACAGQSGEANAKVAALILNDKEVRRQLAEDNIVIPDSTYFLACLHDTTLDVVTLFNISELPSSYKEDLENIQEKLSQAGKLTRAERAMRMSMQEDSHIDAFIKERSKDWSQVRPEWGLAGCSSFVVAPRAITREVDLGGRSFLHSYNWKEDKGFKVLESIMTAPMIVTSWINLQYYGSTVDNKHFGSGNKTLHNVTSGIGVLEGFAGDLRSGLPIQSIHDGLNYQHEPLRLSVVINAPKEAMNEILKKHPSVQQLCDNKWIFLMAMDDDGQISDVYKRELQWKKFIEEKEAHTGKAGLMEALV